MERREDDGDESLVSLDELIGLLKDNRTDSRSLVVSLLPICGLLLTATLGVLYFVLNDTDNKLHISRWVSIILFIASFGFVAAIILCILSVRLIPPHTPIKKIELEQCLDKLYRKEYNRVGWSIKALVLSIMLFILALAIFAYNCNHMDTVLDILPSDAQRDNWVLNLIIIVAIIVKYLFRLII